MKPEHWQHLDALFHKALELPTADREAFLNEACVDDVSLRKEIEALLIGHERSGTFMNRPALDMEARGMATDQPEKLVGQTFGRYLVVSSLGVGGMGDVYLAQDTQLGRRVALKFLSERFTSDLDRERRFQLGGESRFRIEPSKHHHCL